MGYARCYSKNAINTSQSCCHGYYGATVSILCSFIPMDSISFETAVQQGDPLGSLFFCVVLHKLVANIASDEEASQLLFHKWYMDDGVVAGTVNVVARVIAIIKEQDLT